MTTKGTLISIEGIDGTGKSTLTRLLSEKMRQHGGDVVQTKEPGGTQIGEHLIQFMHYDKKKISPLSEFFLFSAGRAHHFETVVLPALAQGRIVISDRMADSSLAYQGYGRGVDIHKIGFVNSWAMQGRDPDYVIYVKLDWQTASKRLTRRNVKLTSFEEEQADFWSRVSSGFEKIFKDRTNVIRLDGSKTQDELVQDAFVALQERGVV